MKLEHLAGLRDHPDAAIERPRAVLDAYALIQHRLPHSVAEPRALKTVAMPVPTGYELGRAGEI